ncbi:transferrin [Cephus cinctus]|uniref:Transferrin n=1 Tax=Cephus cinctus TaxID=211228 RepID=A0AAJ7BXY6_CEPCN|nr:transferrin [Cephus cinctus]
MRNMIFLFFFVASVSAQERYRLCAPQSISDNTCYSLQRGESQVSCLRVEDSADCAIKLSRGDADFGVFTAEELLLAHQFYPTGLQLISQLRHKDKIIEEFEFQSVAVVPTTYNSVEGNFNGLQNGGLCHPGFSKAQMWNNYILKYFEKKVYGSTCRDSMTTAENEAMNLQNFFGKACRPGEWVSDNAYTTELKNKYPDLCSLCDTSSSCTYRNMDNHGHTGALDCLTSGRGKVAYVALNYVRQYFALDSPAAIIANMTASSYQFLCPNGTVQPLTTSNPCAWVKQPWSAIAVRDDRASSLLEGLKNWLKPTRSAEDWTTALRSIIQQDAVPNFFTEYTSFETYLRKGREVSFPTSSCGNTIRWCTISTLETNKCNWIAKAAVTHGIEPQISCDQTNSTFHCFHDIADHKADIITIDSNYGHLARQVFNLTTVLYTETETDRNSVVIAVVREGSSYNVSSFAALSKRTACFPEYGGIAWLSFINTARTNGVLSESCDYATIVADFLSGACTPGFRDRDHLNSSLTSSAGSTLCSLCPLENNNATCSANSSNIYYGDKGALECLKSTAGDIAFIEAKNLNAYIEQGLINASHYRVLCKNSSLALYTGFNVDDQCALSVTIDSEMVGRKSDEQDARVKLTDITLALLQIEDWLGYRTNVLRPIHVYGPFNGTKDLLFKDSTSGLESTSSTIKSVLAYKELFQHVQTCSSSATLLLTNISIILVGVLFLVQTL